MENFSPSRNEKMMLAVGSAFVLMFLLLNFFVLPVFEDRDLMRSKIAAKKKGLKEIQKLGDEYKQLQSGSSSLEQRIKARSSSFTLFSFLEKTAAEAKVKQLIKYMKPSVVTGDGPLKESMVEMKLEKITLGQLVGYLKLVESEEYIVFLKRLSVQEHSREAGFLDVIMQIQTFN